MLVYADRSEIADIRERLALVGERLARIAEMPGGIDRHARLVGALIEAGQLLQGIEDAELPKGAVDTLVHDLALCVIRSWDSGFVDVGQLPAIPATRPTSDVELRLPEGFAFYSVYPEAYVEAARRLKLLAAPRVIGIRSIGTTLGAVVAAALEAPPAITVRPFGDPFARQVELPGELLDREAHYVIVDEGPGLSGSSFGAVADWLQSRGIALERIAFIPSHGGDPGPRASEVHRRRWERAQRIAADFDGRLQELVRGWAGALLGPGDRFKFAGLGAIGERKFELARSLHATGFTSEPVALVHGFLIERYPEGTESLAPNDKPLAEIGRYIAERAQLFPALAAGGASIEKLLEMCCRNVSLSLGDEAARSLCDWIVERLASRVVPVRTDNRMDRANWLRSTDGRLLKADALDHHQGHHLIGCQDIAWDVAGAIVEFDLNSGESALLIDTIRSDGHPVDPELLAFCRTAYAAFRLGEATLNRSPDAKRYASALSNILDQHVRGKTRPKSLVG